MLYQNKSKFKRHCNLRIQICFQLYVIKYVLQILLFIYIRNRWLLNYWFAIQHYNV